jgi:hypothetical protein
MNVRGFSEMVRYPMLMKAKKNEIYVSKQFTHGLSQKVLEAIIDNDLFDKIPRLRRGNKGEIRKVRVDDVCASVCMYSVPWSACLCLAAYLFVLFV